MARGQYLCNPLLAPAPPTRDHDCMGWSGDRSMVSGLGAVRRRAKISVVSRGETGLRLWLFLLLSLSLHAGLLLALASRTAPGVTGQAQTLLSVRLSVEKAPAEVPVKRSAPAAVSRHPKQTARLAAAKASTRPKASASVPEPAATVEKTSPLQLQAPTPEVTQPVPARPATQAALDSSAVLPHAESATEPDTTTSSRASAREQIRRLLLKDLARNFTYPLIARRRGWEGKVLLAITVQSNGRVVHVRITRSSGFDILDRSAVNTLQNVGQLADAAPWLHGQALELLLPVVYRLTD